ncbi:MAG: DUF3854 domain-containing protein [Oscillospiraceae bacterium]|jgi:hypothetical protein|nr:DUF3854 domain-containing protein [Oscillospiraceae bacterium]
MQYAEIPIADAARRCGIVFNDRTLKRREVEAQCPFCGDKPRKYHLGLNTERNVYKCFLCGASGNSVSLYARLKNLSYRDAADDLLGGSNVYKMPEPPTPKAAPEREPRPLDERHAVYSAMLRHLTLDARHRENLRDRGLSDERIERNVYRSLPESPRARQFLAGMLSDFYGLDGIPGFWKNDEGRWDIAGKPGLLIPYRDKDGLIQGVQIRLDDAADTERRYRWLASTRYRMGTKSGAHIHVTGSLSAGTAYITEGGLKGDVASFHDGDALFVCVAGVNAILGLRETLASLAARDFIIAMDMDKLINRQVRAALQNMSKELSALKGARVHIANWDAGYKGIDDYYFARKKAGRQAPLRLEAA